MLLRVLYFLLKRIGILFAHIYYRVTFMDRENFKLPKGPCIMTINHPNTMMDIIVVVPLINRYTHFLANAGLFVNPVLNWLLRKLWCIPIKRKSDTGSQINNEDSFSECVRFLNNGGLLLIAPEGSSRNERHVRKFRTGTALIALRTEAENDFKLGLKICPFGITYDRPWQFRSRVYVKADKPVSVANYKQIYRENPEQAIALLTAELEEKTRQMTVDTDNKVQEKLLRKLEILSNTRHFAKTGQWLSGLQRFKLAQKLTDSLKKLHRNQTVDYEVLEKSTLSYFAHLSKLKISEFAIAFAQSGSAPWLFVLFIALGLPFFIAGLLLNAIPLLLTELAWRIMKLEDYEATIRIVLGGLIFFPMSYGFCTAIFSGHFQFEFFGILYWIISVLLGIFAWEYYRTYGLLIKIWRVKLLTKSTLLDLQEQKAKISAEIVVLERKAE